MSIEVPPVHRSEIDGVPVFWSPKGGSLRCGLFFRVGMADESFRTKGITHLIEHLVLEDGGGVEHEYNGSVSTLLTTFTASGTPAEVKEFLETVCARLSALPFDKLHAERSVLRREAADREISGADVMFEAQYGPAGAGLIPALEHGLVNASTDEIRDWARRYFTRHNAALWLTGPVPDGLRLTLPDGERVPPPPTVPADEPTPAFFEGPGGGFTLSMRGSAEGYLPSITSAYLQDRLMRVLRFEGALTYHVDASHHAVDGHNVLFTVSCATDDEHGEEALVKAIVELDAIASGQVDEAGLRKAKRGFLDFMTDPASLDGVVGNSAVSHLVDGIAEDPAAVVATVEALTPADIASLVASALPTLVATTDRLPAELADRLADTSYSAGPPLGGRRYKTRWSASMTAQMVVGEEGVSFFPKEGNGRHTTLRYEDLTALEVHDDGDRILVGRTGRRIPVIATAWKNSQQLIASIEKHVPAELRVRVFYSAAPTATEVDMIGGQSTLPPVDPAVVEAARAALRKEYQPALYIGVAALFAAGVLALAQLFTLAALLALIGLGSLVFFLPLRFRPLATAEPRLMIATGYMTAANAKRGYLGLVALFDPEIDGGVAPVRSFYTTAKYVRRFTSRRQPVFMFGGGDKEAVAVTSLEDGAILGISHKSAPGVNAIVEGATPVPRRD